MSQKGIPSNEIWLRFRNELVLYGIWDVNPFSKSQPIRYQVWELQVYKHRNSQRSFAFYEGSAPLNPNQNVDPY